MKGKILIMEEIAKQIYNLSENDIYLIIEKFDENQQIDKSLTYIYIKAFYIHCVKIYLQSNKKENYFKSIFEEYKKQLIEYYKMNNNQIPLELIGDIKDAFDKSFEIIESLEFTDIYDGYEYRHHIISIFELLRKILEKKSKNQIREDIFENHITSFRNKSEEIMEYLDKNL